MARSKFHIDEEEVLDQEKPVAEEVKKVPEAKPEKKDSPVKTKEITQKKKPGRPKVKTEPTKTINIAIPISILEQIEIALPKYQGNLTKYVNTVIEQDLQTNMKEYKKIYNILNN